jgi:hypothetical protein
MSQVELGRNRPYSFEMYGLFLLTTPEAATLRGTYREVCSLTTDSKREFHLHRKEVSRISIDR